DGPGGGVCRSSSHTTRLSDPGQLSASGTREECCFGPGSRRRGAATAVARRFATPGTCTEDRGLREFRKLQSRQRSRAAGAALPPPSVGARHRGDLHLHPPQGGCSDPPCESRFGCEVAAGRLGPAKFGGEGAPEDLPRLSGTGDRAIQLAEGVRGSQG